MRRAGAWRQPSLIDAATQGDVAPWRSLRERVDVDAAEADGTTALHWAVRGRHEVARALLLGAGRRRDGGQPLRHDAAAAGRRATATPP